MDETLSISERIERAKEKVEFNSPMYKWQEQALISIGKYPQTVISVPTGSG